MKTPLVAKKPIRIVEELKILTTASSYSFPAAEKQTVLQFVQLPPTTPVATAPKEYGKIRC